MQDWIMRISYGQARLGSVASRERNTARVRYAHLAASAAKCTIRRQRAVTCRGGGELPRVGGYALPICPLSRRGGDGCDGRGAVREQRDIKRGPAAWVRGSTATGTLCSMEKRSARAMAGQAQGERAVGSGVSWSHERVSWRGASAGALVDISNAVSTIPRRMVAPTMAR